MLIHRSQFPGSSKFPTLCLAGKLGRCSKPGGLTIGFVLLAVCLETYGADPSLDFNRDIRPILSENCFACHGFDEKSRQADLRLDVVESAYADRDGSVAIVPGELDKSGLWQRVMSDDEDEVMPPRQSHLKLSDKEKTLLRKWIEQGAPYAGHWSFIPPKKTTPPASTREDAIDYFVRQRLIDEGLTASKPADRATLIRRLSFDLIGLPPTAEEVEAFVNATSAEAYTQLVDRLLQSPHFGERLAIEWLDAARYADTNGFSIDGGRHLWLWRDWVIQAFNDNMPYDRFLVEQIAGDQLPNRTDSQLIATGFQRNNMVTHEGGTIPEENLTNYNADRVKTLGESVLGLTLGCAQCHDHKFDPITQREYYQMFAFFNTLSDKGLDGNGGVNPGPSTKARTVLRTDEESELRARIESLRASLSQLDAKILEAWESRQRAKLAKRGDGFAIHPVSVVKISTPNRGAGFEIENGNRVRLMETGAIGAFDIATELPKLAEPITGLRVIVHPVDELPGGGWGNGPTMKTPARGKAAAKKADEGEEAESYKGTFMLTAIAATADRVQGDQINLFKLQGFESVTANSWEPKNPPFGCLDPRNDDGWSPDLATEGPVHLSVTFTQPIIAEATPHLTVQLNFGSGSSLIPELIELVVFYRHRRWDGSSRRGGRCDRDTPRGSQRRGEGAALEGLCRPCIGARSDPGSNWPISPNDSMS